MTPRTCAHLQLTRLAGESFSLITGLDLAYLDLERKPPEGVELGATENPEDEHVGMDLDDSLPWPDSEKIQKWWDAHRKDFHLGSTISWASRRGGSMP